MTQATTRLSAPALEKRLGGRSTGTDRPGAAGGSPAYRELADRIRSAVLDGRLPITSGLPSERTLAERLGMSRTTVAAAYALLREDGWLSSRRGSGSRLQFPDPANGPGAAGHGADPLARRGMAAPARPGIFGHDRHSGVDDLVDLSTASLPAVAGPLLAAVQRATAALPQYLTSDGYAPFGLPQLRAVIAERYTAAGVPTTAEQILVTGGAQHSFTLALQELSVPGDRVLIECPTYPVALDAIRVARRTPSPLGLLSGENPWDPELLAATIRQTVPRLGYLIPDFQNPTGALMDLPTREQLVASARATNTLLLIDESFRDVPFTSTGPLPPLVAALGDDSRVVSLGSVSKSLWGGLRVGWIRAARGIVDRLAVARALGDMAGPVLEQLIVAELLGDLEESLLAQRTRLTAGAAALGAALAATLPDWQPTRPLGGVSLWARLPGPFATELARLAPSVGVRIAPGPRFGPDGTMDSFVRLPFAQAPERLATAVERLAAVAGQAAVTRAPAMPGWLT